VLELKEADEGLAARLAEAVEGWEVTVTSSMRAATLCCLLARIPPASVRSGQQ
jgi:hypothetical protein